jgi:hypothetical protein
MLHTLVYFLLLAYTINHEHKLTLWISSLMINLQTFMACLRLVWSFKCMIHIPRCLLIATGFYMPVYACILYESCLLILTAPTLDSRYGIGPSDTDR